MAVAQPVKTGFLARLGFGHAPKPPEGPHGLYIWGSVGRVFGRPGFNTPLMLKVVQRVKHMIGYPDSALEKLTAQGDTPVLTDAEHYGMGTERPLAEYMKLTGIDVEHKRCPAVKWCNNEELL